MSGTHADNKVKAFQDRCKNSQSPNIIAESFWVFIEVFFGVFFVLLTPFDMQKQFGGLNRIIFPKNRHHFPNSKAIMHYKSKHFYKGLRDLFPKQVASYWALQMCTEAQVSSNTLPRNLTFEQLQRIAQIYYSLCQKYQDLFEFNYQQPNRHIPLGLLNDSKHLEETSMRKDEEEILSYDTSWDHEQIDADDEAFLELTDDNNEFLDNDESIFIR